ncbi:MAG: patatin-like phospholipase family protein [Deltaproteobacteria bacterium]|nr:patatin-like phospholipase family protein [Deltaproteobacteria bacterium]
MKKDQTRKTALVLSGGGARGAYEAGIIHYLRTMLPPKIRNHSFDIQCGSSVGAINSSFMASSAHDLELQGRRIHEVWSKLTPDRIYRRQTIALLDFLRKGGRGLLMNFIRRNQTGIPHFRGFLDTSPFLPFMEQEIDWKQITRNIKAGLVQALSISATNVFTGRLELFIQKRDDVEYSGSYITHFTKIRPIHTMASAAIPIIFPTVDVDGIPYTDGGLRLNTPMSPAIQLGADSLFIIGLHHRAKPGEKIPSIGKKGVPPSMGQVLGRVMNSIFLDRTQYDLEQLERINRIIDWSEELYGENYLEDLNQMLRRKEIRGDVADRGLKRLRVLRIRPSEIIGDIFDHAFRKHRDQYFSNFEKFLVRFLDIDPSGGVDFLSYIAFIPEYLKKLIELGFEDARSNHKEIVEFFER